MGLRGISFITELLVFRIRAVILLHSFNIVLLLCCGYNVNNKKGKV